MNLLNKLWSKWQTWLRKGRRKPVINQDAVRKRVYETVMSADRDTAKLISEDIPQTLGHYELTPTGASFTRDEWPEIIGDEQP